PAGSRNNEQKRPMSERFVTAISDSPALDLPSEPPPPAVLVPQLEALPSGNAMVPYEPPKKARWTWRKPAPEPDEFEGDATRAGSFVANMRNALTCIQANICNDAWVQ